MWTWNIMEPISCYPVPKSTQKLCVCVCFPPVFWHFDHFWITSIHKPSIHRTSVRMLKPCKITLLIRVRQSFSQGVQTVKPFEAINYKCFCWGNKYAEETIVFVSHPFFWDRIYIYIYTYTYVYIYNMIQYYIYIHNTHPTRMCIYIYDYI